MDREKKISDELFIKYFDSAQAEVGGADYVRYLRAICDYVAQVSLEG